MTILRWIQFIAGALCIVGGLVFFAIEIIGVFRFDFVLNRIHAGALGDTLGIGLFFLGAILLFGISVDSLKILLVLIFLWLTAPVASHMVGKLEVKSRKDPEEICPVETLDEPKDADEKGEEV